MANTNFLNSLPQHKQGVFKHPGDILVTPAEPLEGVEEGWREPTFRIHHATVTTAVKPDIPTLRHLIGKKTYTYTWTIKGLITTDRPDRKHEISQRPADIIRTLQTSGFEVDWYDRNRYKSEVNAIAPHYGTSNATIGPTKELTGGPHTQSINVRKWDGLNAHITWTFTAVLGDLFFYQASKRSKKQQPIQYLTYTVQYNYDRNLYATRTISGIARLNLLEISPVYDTKQSDPKLIQRDGHSADYYRPLIEAMLAEVPFETSKPRIEAWQRLSQDWRLTEDHTQLAFQVTDKQVQRYHILENITTGDVQVSTNLRPIRGDSTLMRLDYSIRGWFECTPPGPQSKGKQVAVAKHQQVLNYIINLWTYKYVVAATRQISDQMTRNDAIYRFNNSSIDQSLFDGKISFSLSFSMHNVEGLSTVPLEAGEQKWQTPFTNLIHNFAFLTECQEGIVTRLHKFADKEYKAPNKRLSRSSGTSDVGGLPGSSEGFIGLNDIRFKDLKAFTDELEAFTEDPQPKIPEEDKGETPAKTPYRSFSQVAHYNHIIGKRVIPLFNESYTVQEVQSPKLRVTVTGSATSLGEPPPIGWESPEYFIHEALGTDSENVILLAQEVTPSAPTADGIYAVSWRYVFEVINTDDLKSQLRLPRSPYDLKKRQYSGNTHVEWDPEKP